LTCDSYQSIPDHMGCSNCKISLFHFSSSDKRPKRTRNVIKRAQSPCNAEEANMCRALSKSDTSHKCQSVVGYDKTWYMAFFAIPHSWSLPSMFKMWSTEFHCLADIQTYCVY
jgi:hypothetical protein